MKAFLLTTASLLALALLLAAMLFRLELDHRLDAFLPAPADDASALVADQLGDSAAGRMILAALEGGEPRALAEASRTLAAAWRNIPGIVAVHNGDTVDYKWGEGGSREADEAPLEGSGAWLLLIPDPAAYLSQAAVGAALEERVADLALGGTQAEEWIRRDPLGLMRQLEPLLAPADSPETFDGVWFGRERQRALLIAMTDEPAFDPAAQRAIVTEMRDAAAALPDAVVLTLTGPAVFSTDIDRAARSDATRLTAAAVLWLLLLLALVWRRPVLILAGAVPLLAGVCAGLAVVLLGYSAVHGLTLAFGFTLLGVVLDYPVHLFSHSRGPENVDSLPRGRGRAGEGAFDAAARAIRLPLSLSAVSSLIAFAAIWFSASPGLAQIGAFSAVGLVMAAALTVIVLPRLRLPRPPEAPGFLAPLMAAPRGSWLPALVLLVSAGGLAAVHDQLWSDDLRRLSPIDPSWLETDRELRRDLRAPEARYLLVIVEPELEAALNATENLTEALAGARQAGLVGDWQAVTPLVPSPSVQAARREAWPDAGKMAEKLRVAGAPLGFRAEAFRPFLEDLARLPTQPGITPDTWRGTALAPRVDSLLQHTPRGWRSLVLPSGIEDPAAFSLWLENRGLPVRLVDLAAVSQAMAADYRRQVLNGLAVALGLIMLLVGVRLAGAAEAFRVITPPLAAVAATALVMHSGGGLTVVHLMALILVAGIGLDYALFMTRLSAAAAEGRATLWSLIICAASTGGVFLILGQSDIPLLAQLGRTVALGIGLSWLLVWLGCRHRPLP